MSRLHPDDDRGAKPDSRVSRLVKTGGMVICPRSMGTAVAAIAGGTSRSPGRERAADVTLQGTAQADPGPPGDSTVARSPSQSRVGH